MKKQTAVEWLVDEFKEKLMGNNLPEWVEKIIEQAKAMEKEQIEEACYSSKYNSYKAICSGCNKPNPTVNRDMFVWF